MLDLIQDKGGFFFFGANSGVAQLNILPVTLALYSLLIKPAVLLLSTRETVLTETPARRATSLCWTRRVLRPLLTKSGVKISPLANSRLKETLIAFYQVNKAQDIISNLPQVVTTDLHKYLRNLYAQTLLTA